MCGMWMSASIAAYGLLLQALSASFPSTAVSEETPSNSNWRTSTSRFTGGSSTTSTSGCSAGLGSRRAPPAERRGAGIHRDAATFGEFQGIAEQVEQNLPHAGRIADQRIVRARFDGAGQHQALGIPLRLERAQHPVDQP